MDSKAGQGPIQGSDKATGATNSASGNHSPNGKATPQSASRPQASPGKGAGTPNAFVPPMQGNKP